MEEEVMMGAGGVSEEGEEERMVMFRYIPQRIETIRQASTSRNDPMLRCFAHGCTQEGILTCPACCETYCHDCYAQHPEIAHARSVMRKGKKHRTK